jgi:hypothetical protein
MLLPTSTQLLRPILTPPSYYRSLFYSGSLFYYLLYYTPTPSSGSSFPALQTLSAHSPTLTSLSILLYLDYSPAPSYTSSPIITYLDLPLVLTLLNLITSLNFSHPS